MLFRNIFSGRTRPARAPRNSANQAAPARLSTQTLRLLDRLRLNTGPFMPGLPAGSRISQMRKPAADFRDHRQYTPGDDVRYVDWKASARQEHVFVKQGEIPKAAMVYILIDCSASMRWGNPPKSQAALALASALGYLALSHSDRLVIVPVTGSAPATSAAAASRQTTQSFQRMGPFWGKGQAPMLNSYFEGLRFEGQINLTQAVVQLSQRKLSQGGLVLVITDMFGSDGLPKALARLQAPAWQVVFCHMLHPDEVNPELNGYFEMLDIETQQKKRYQITAKVLETYRQRLQAWQSELAQMCLESSAVYSMFPTNWSLESEMIAQLQRIRVVERL